MIVLWAVASLTSLAVAGWAISVRQRNANVVDQLWGVSLMVLAALCLAFGEKVTARSFITSTLVFVWGVRLSAYLVVRSRGRGEEWRHRDVRARSPRFAARSLVELFLFQLVGGAIVVGLPLFAVVSADQPGLRWLDAVAVTTWVAGFVVEAVADAQLARFRATRSAAAVLDAGLWRYSRHPNYFGELVQWLGIALLGVAARAWWALASPSMMLLILVKMSGVAVMDRHLRETRGRAYEEYCRTTSSFVPLPKRRRGEHPA